MILKVNCSCGAQEAQLVRMYVKYISEIRARLTANVHLRFSHQQPVASRLQLAASGFVCTVADEL